MYPAKHPARASDGKSGRAFTWPQIVAQWQCIVVDFQRLYQLNLADEFPRRPWLWFEPLIVGLMQTPESLLRATLMAAKEG